MRTWTFQNIPVVSPPEDDFYGRKPRNPRPLRVRGTRDPDSLTPGPCRPGAPTRPILPGTRGDRTPAQVHQPGRHVPRAAPPPGPPWGPHGGHLPRVPRPPAGLHGGVGRGGRASPTSRAGGVVERQRGLAGGQAAQHVSALGHGGGRVVVHLLGGDVVVDDGLPVLQRGCLGVATDEIGRVQVRVGGVRGQVPGQVIGSGRWERDMGSEVRHTHTLTASPPTPRTEPRPPRRQLFP